MEINNSFDVPLPPADAWKVLMDIERIAPCITRGAQRGSPRGHAQDSTAVGDGRTVLLCGAGVEDFGVWERVRGGEASDGFAGQGSRC